ncbi:amastin, putative [Bodo saltans]|uniref:Amastin, putative n=1 Tax=Bodo saltans TaxID=75058 RepID=A0A0S4J3G9_BODSA|nr:amastin, putative [Bodo saltans]|eukprot:CUG67950.1 amastin, putative [Bodo saltans]
MQCDVFFVLITTGCVSPSSNMALPLRLIAILLVLVSTLFVIVAAGTTGWIVGTYGDDFKYHIGLFKLCAGSDDSAYCMNTLDMYNDDDSGVPSSCKSRLMASQAFIVLSILVLFPLLVLIIVRRFMSSGPAGMAASKIPVLVDVVIGVVVLFCLTISWGAIANMYKECICDVLSNDSCGLNYSFALAIIAWLATGAATVFLFLSKSENAGYTDMSAPTLV